MFKPTVAGIMAPFEKMVGKLEDLKAAHTTQVAACDQKMEQVSDKCEAKVEVLRERAGQCISLLHKQKDDSVSELSKAANAITAIKKLTGEVSE